MTICVRKRVVCTNAAYDYQGLPIARAGLWQRYHPSSAITLCIKLPEEQKSPWLTGRSVKRTHQARWRKFQIDCREKGILERMTSAHRVSAASKDDLPALGRPTIPTSATTRMSSCRLTSSPGPPAASIAQFSSTTTPSSWTRHSKILLRVSG